MRKPDPQRKYFYVELIELNTTQSWFLSTQNDWKQLFQVVICTKESKRKTNTQINCFLSWLVREIRREWIQCLISFHKTGTTNVCPFCNRIQIIPRTQNHQQNVFFQFTYFVWLCFEKFCFFSQKNIHVRLRPECKRTTHPQTKPRIFTLSYFECVRCPIFFHETRLVKFCSADYATPSNLHQNPIWNQPTKKTIFTFV